MSSWSRDPFTCPPAGRLLVVDDDPLARQLLSLMLADVGEVIEATNAHEAVGRAVVDRPDLILLDIHLPDLPGVEVCRILKANPHTRAIGILALTVRRNEADRRRALEAGADDYFVKPFNPTELRAKVQDFLAARPGAS